MTDKKIALVTGGARGIGKAIVEALVAKDYFVYFTYYASSALAEEMEKELNRSYECVKKIRVDISREEMVTKLFDLITEENGRLDVLVNNSGVALAKLFTDCTLDDYNDIFGVNVFGTMLVTKYATKLMLKKHEGKIINISSIWGDCGGSFESVYSASKAAINGFTKALAKELGPSNITVNAISPGFIQTDMTKHYTEDVLRDIEDEIPLMRLGVPKDIAKGVISLIDNSYITGQVLSINGGWDI